MLFGSHRGEAEGRPEDPVPPAAVVPSQPLPTTRPPQPTTSAYVPPEPPQPGGVTVQAIINKYTRDTGLSVEDVVAKYARRAADIKASFHTKPYHGQCPL